MPQEQLETQPAATLVSAACYQFALSGSEDKDTLDSIDLRFSAMGNYMLANVQDNVDQLQHVSTDDLDTIFAIADLTEKRTAIMHALIREFGLSGSGSANPTYRLGGRIRTADQLLPEHMWINDSTYSYDTMPQYNIFRDTDADGLLPPLERDIPADQIVCVGLSELTAFQQIIITGPWA